MADHKEAHLGERDLEKRAVLRKHCLFAKLGPEHIERLASCVVARSVKRDTSIFMKGDPGTSLFAIREGMVKITSPSVDGHDAVFNLIGAGDIFGEIALLDGRARTTDAIAITDCEFFVIDRRDFLPLVRSQPEMALTLIEILCARLRQTTEQAESLMFLPLPVRLAKALLRLTDSVGAERDHKLTITQKDLGNIIGMSRESTNRQLRLWEQNKWLRLERGGIVLLAPAALQHIAESDIDVA